jgi:ribokinase
MDLVTYVERMPKIGETILGRDFKQIPGGKGANQAAAIAKLGAKVKLLGCVGMDGMGNMLLDSLQKDEVDISHIICFKDIPTGIAAITVDKAGKNYIVVAPGANYRLLPEQLQDFRRTITDSQVVVTQLEIPSETVRYSLGQAKECSKLTILNPAPALNLDDDLLSYVDLLIPNETELEVLSGRPVRNETEIIEAAQVMIKRGIKELIVTIGEKGCIYINERQHKSFAAYKVNPIDTTAAGDSFIGATAVALNEGKAIEEAISFAMAVAALTVTKKGAQSSLPYRHEVENLLKIQS